MKGQGKYNDLTKEWEEYNNVLLNTLIDKFPNTAKMTQLEVSKMLVELDWMEEIQRYTYKSVLASGRVVSYEDFKNELTAQKMYDGEVIDAWANSRVRAVSRRMVNRIKKHTRVLNSRLTKLRDTEDLKYIEQLLSTMKDKPAGLARTFVIVKNDWELLNDTQKVVRLAPIKEAISNNIKDVQYNGVLKDTVQKVNIFQGRRISQDQLQRANNDILIATQKDFIDGKRPDVELVGYWELSPTHRKHMVADPCEMFASNNDGYGRGSHVGKNIPIPVKDTHTGCKCSLRMEVVKKLTK